MEIAHDSIPFINQKEGRIKMEDFADLFVGMDESKIAKMKKVLDDLGLEITLFNMTRVAIAAGDLKLCKYCENITKDCICDDIDYMDSELVKSLDRNEEPDVEILLMYFRVLSMLMNQQPDVLDIMNEFDGFTSLWVLADIDRDLYFNFRDGKFDVEDPGEQIDMKITTTVASFLMVIQNRAQFPKHRNDIDFKIYGDMTKLFGLYPALERLQIILDG
jgi:hypothetical protein